MPGSKKYYPSEERYREFCKLMRICKPTKKTLKVFLRETSVKIGKLTDSGEPMAHITMRRYYKRRIAELSN